MLKSYFKIAWRNLLKNRASSFINIGGLAVGMAVALLIGLWIYDELSFNKYHQNYDHIAQVMKHETFNGERVTLIWNPYLMGDILRNEYGSDFKRVVMSTYPSGHILTYKEKKIIKEGNYMDQEAPNMLSLEMIKGSQDGLKDPNSILLSESVAKVFFGNDDPINKFMRIDNMANVKVMGVYKDMPFNSEFRNLSFIAPWVLLLNISGMKADPDPWNNNNYLTYVQIADQSDMNKISIKIKDLKKNKLSKVNADLYKPEVFLQPMSKWHLYSEFKNGVNTGGRIQFVWLFCIIGIFVLLLACINFINLSTARSQNRAKEIGIRKTIGSNRCQLINQFFTESLLIIVFSFLLGLLLVQLVLPFFNEIADKKISILWTNPWFWVSSIFFCFFTGIVAGLYPSFYLSSFEPVKVLKGTFKAGHFAILQRKTLVVLQFTVSVILIIGTIVVFRQIQFAKNREIGFNPKDLITMPITPEINNHFNSFRDELKNSGAAIEVDESANSTTESNIVSGGFNWVGKDPNLSTAFPISNVTHGYGKTIGWKIKEGRDFSGEFTSDSSAFILNEAAVKFMGLKNPIGKTIKWNDKPFQVIGVIKDIIFESPYQSIRPYIYQMTGDQSYVVTVKINTRMGVSKALSDIEKIFGKYNPELPFDYKFIDQEYSKKFGDEERIGKLASFFAVLAIFISCLGIFGLATFIAEQRTKEVGVRKVLGASVFSIWRLLSKDFIMLLIISLIIASPTAYYFMHNWLQNYPYHSEISWWIFVLAGIGALLITLLTVSFQAIKAALMNPVKCLRME
jgi:putative ABC transport system permease protein